jgi:putative proteasome-type protease
VVTFCVGVRVQGGLVGLADTQIVKGGEVTSKAKLSLHDHGGRRYFVVTSGLRSVRDKVVLRLEDELAAERDAHVRLHQIATALGDELRHVRAEDGPSLDAGGLRFNLHAIIGGQLAGDQEAGLFLVYPEGNWVTATDDAPSFIIGRTAYGKPILDRLLTPVTPPATRTRRRRWARTRPGWPTP